MATSTHKLLILAVATTSDLVLGCSTSKPLYKPTRSASSLAALSLEQGAPLSGQVTKDEGDSIIAVGRNSATRVVASTKKGFAFEIDTETGTVTKLQPLMPVRDPNSYLFTVSKKYVWEFAAAAGTVGRNKNAFGGTQVTISKADIKDLVTDVNALVPLAASETQLYLCSKTHLLVFTWQGDKLGRQRIKLSRKIGDDEPILGAGPMNEAEPDKAIWLATAKKLMLFNGASWGEKSFSVNSAQGEFEFVSLYFKSETEKQPSDPIIGLMESGSLATLVVAASSKPAAQADAATTTAQGEVAK
ncbi:MAG: hypothetical protein FJ146_06300 [Deltaproteobacteria bacterium]|nr:hypothetical protein [Deltaproteobacteria bacterium]